MSLQSEFYKDLSKYQVPIKWGLTKKQLKMVFYCLPGAGCVIAESFFLPDVLFILVAIVTSLVLIAPFIVIGLDKWDTILYRFSYEFIILQRNYETGQIRRYDKHEFIQKKDVSEIDGF